MDPSDQAMDQKIACFGWTSDYFLPLTSFHISRMYCETGRKDSVARGTEPPFPSFAKLTLHSRSLTTILLYLLWTVQFQYECFTHWYSFPWRVVLDLLWIKTCKTKPTDCTGRRLLFVYRSDLISQHDVHSFWWTSQLAQVAPIIPALKRSSFSPVILGATKSSFLMIQREEKSRLIYRRRTTHQGRNLSSYQGGFFKTVLDHWTEIYEVRHSEMVHNFPFSDSDLGLGYTVSRYDLIWCMVDLLTSIDTWRTQHSRAECCSFWAAHLCARQKWG